MLIRKAAAAATASGDSVPSPGSLWRSTHAGVSCLHPSPLHPLPSPCRCQVRAEEEAKAQGGTLATMVSPATLIREAGVVGTRARELARLVGPTHGAVAQLRLLRIKLILCVAVQARDGGADTRAGLPSPVGLRDNDDEE